MSLTLYAHPFSSYCWKALIPLWADETPFTYVHVGKDEGAMDRLRALWPLARFPLLEDGGEVIVEASCIVEHLAARHPGPNCWLPDGEAGRRARFLDRLFDLHVQANMQVAVANALRPEGTADAYGEARARAALATTYDWLDAHLPDEGWAVGDRFTLADVSAAPALFYADWVEPIGSERPRLAAYRARLLGHPVVARAVEEARPYRRFFPLGAPDRD